MALTAEQHFNRAKQFASNAEEHYRNSDYEEAGYAAAIATAHATIAQADAVCTAAHWLSELAKRK